MNKRISLLSSKARVQVPWIKVTIGNYTFGVFSRKGRTANIVGNYTDYKVQYPNYVQSLNITKINGQVNQYSLTLIYPVRDTDDPNFFEKVFSSVSGTRKIVFSYGDAAVPSFIYKDEEAIITKVTQTFNLEASTIQYTVEAVSGAALAGTGSYNFIADGAKHKPSDIIKKLFKTPKYNLQNLFTGMSVAKLPYFIAGDDQAVKLESKFNITVLDYINYLVSCMLPASATNTSALAPDIYILTIHDETSYDKVYGDDTVKGPYFKITKTSYKSEQNDAYEIDIGFNTAEIVSKFTINKNENYSMYYDYQKKLHPEEYVERLNSNGSWEKVYAPVCTSNNKFETEPDDISWWTKITKYPVSASITIQGLLRPAILMSYVRLNVIFPGGHKHISSGLYIVTKQTDSIGFNGYKTTLELTKISGDNYISTNPSGK